MATKSKVSAGILSDAQADKRGEIVKTYVGPPKFDELHRLIESLLAET